MKRLILVIILLLSTSSAFAFLDVLQLYDPYLPFLPGFELAGGVSYELDDRTWDDAGSPTALSDLNRKESSLLIPIRIGFAPTNHWRITALLPVVAPSHTAQAMGVDVTESTFGLSNPWLCTSYIWAPFEGNLFRPRLSVKFPTFAQTEEDFIPHGATTTGDKSWNVDFTLAYFFRPKDGLFLADIWCSGRYATEATYNIAGNTYSRQPPLTLSGEVALGKAWDEKHEWESFLLGNLLMDMYKAAYEGYGEPGTQRRRLCAGIRQNWSPSYDGTLIFDFTYGLTGQNITTGLELGLGYCGYLAL